MFNSDNIGEELAKLVYEGLEYEDYWDQTFSNKDFGVQIMSWAEYGISYGRIVAESDDFAVKVGGRIKLMQGLLSAYMFAEDFQYEFSDADTLSIFQTDVDYGHSSNVEFTQDDFKYKFIANPTIGFDLGVTYEQRLPREEYLYDMDGETDIL